MLASSRTGVRRSQDAREEVHRAQEEEGTSMACEKPAAAHRASRGDGSVAGVSAAG